MARKRPRPLPPAPVQPPGCAAPENRSYDTKNHRAEDRFKVVRSEGALSATLGTMRMHLCQEALAAQLAM